MTTATGNVARDSTEKEKVEKRRALGRGLDSLLPGPRVVPAAPAAAPAQSGTAAGQQQVPHRPSGPIRNDIGKETVTAASVASGLTDSQATSHATPEHTVAMIHGVVEDAGVEKMHASAAVPTQIISPASAAQASGAQASDESITILAQAEGRIPGNLVVNLSLTVIDKNPFQTRYVDRDDALDELAESIKVSGVVQPIVVRPAEVEGRYILVVGERRLHASKLAGRDVIPALVRRISDQQAAEMTIVENLQREDLSALEQAEAFRVLSKEFQLTQAEIGERVGLSRESVSNYMRLLKLPEQTMKRLALGEISFQTAKELLKLESPELIAKTADHVVEKGLTFDQVERLVMRMMGYLDPVPGMPTLEKKRSGARWVDPNVRAAQLELERLLGVRVRIRDRKGKGKIVIEYATVDDYERVVEALRRKSVG
jgi:ParB family chromosome partitioning protein